jgi:hypothetical protein
MAMPIGYGRAHPSAGCGAYYDPCLARAYTTFYLPVVFVPVALYSDDAGHAMRVPHDVEVQPATSPQSVLIGGSREVSLSLEYLIEPGATSPGVKLNTSFDGTTSNWSDANTAPGYYVKHALLIAKPGTKVTIAVNDAMARLRWLETIYC